MHINEIKQECEVEISIKDTQNYSNLLRNKCSICAYSE